jgi:hypothetical protein
MLTAEHVGSDVGQVDDQVVAVLLNLERGLSP